MGRSNGIGMAALLLAAVPSGVQAQSAPAPASPPTAQAEVHVVDPARLAAARVTVDAIFPNGTYARLLNGTMDKMLDTMMGSMGQIPMSQLAKMVGAKPDDVAKMPKATLEDIMAIYDPAFHTRLSAATHAIMTDLLGMMSELEPQIRDGLAQAYADHYTVDQLNEINRFFATPTGKLYASNMMVLQMDPAVMSKMQAFVPAMMKAMPDMIKRAEAATKDIPKPRKWDDLSPAERTRLAKLLGTTEAELAKSEQTEKPAK